MCRVIFCYRCFQLNEPRPGSPSRRQQNVLTRRSLLLSACLQSGKRRKYRVVPHVAGSNESLALHKYVNLAFLSQFSMHECRITNAYLATCIVRYLSLFLYFQLRLCKQRMIEFVWEIASCWLVNNSHLLMTVKTKALGSFETSVTIQGDPWLMDITAGDDFPGLCDQTRFVQTCVSFWPFTELWQL